MKRVFRFLHISDLHLASAHPLCPADADAEKADTFYRLMLQSLQNSVSTVKQRQLDALLIAGDLFEATTIEHRVLKDALSLLSECKVPVVIAPGNHDLYNIAYKQERLNFYGISFPENVYVFSSPDFSCKDIEGICFYGIANTTRDIKPFEKLPSIDCSYINIAIFHGSLLSFLPEGKEVWLPFTREELLSSGFDYIALGHYHAYAEIKDSSGTVRAIYPGSATPTVNNEKGPRGGVVIEIEKTDKHSLVKAEFVPLSALKIKDVTISITEEHGVEEIERLLLSEIPEQERASTVLCIKAEGSGYSNLLKAIEVLSEQYLHIDLDVSSLFSDNIDILTALHSPETIAGRFIKAIQEEMENTDEAGRKLLRNALLYGLDALRGKEIEPRYEDRKIQS